MYLSPICYNLFFQKYNCYFFIVYFILDDCKEYKNIENTYLKNKK